MADFKWIGSLESESIQRARGRSEICSEVIALWHLHRARPLQDYNYIYEEMTSHLEENVAFSLVVRLVAILSLESAKFLRILERP